MNWPFFFVTLGPVWLGYCCCGMANWIDLLNPLEGTDRGKKEGQVGHGWEDREHYLELALHEEKLLLTTVI